MLTAEDLALPAGSGLTRPPAPASVGSPRPPEEVGAERGEIEALLLEAGGSVSKAAARLGVSRQALYRRMEKLGIVLERRPRS